GRPRSTSGQLQRIVRRRPQDTYSMCSNKEEAMRARAVMAMAAGLLIGGGSFSGADETANRCDRGGEFLGQVKPVLYVKDVKASAAFFRDVLGFAFLNWADNEDAPYYAEMAAGTQKFGLHLPGDARERARVGQQRIYFRVRNVAA